VLASLLTRPYCMSFCSLFLQFRVLGCFMFHPYCRPSHSSPCFWKLSDEPCTNELKIVNTPFRHDILFFYLPVSGLQHWYWFFQSGPWLYMMGYYDMADHLHAPDGRACIVIVLNSTTSDLEGDSMLSIGPC
jgi:hypothetical protein